MSALPISVGDLTAVYTATQYTAGATPRVGTVRTDAKGTKKYIFLKNAGASAIAAKIGAIATTTMKSSYFCTLASTTVASNENLFAGFRVSGATSMAQDEYGWFQISGSATVTASSDTTTAEVGVCFSNQTAGTVEASADTAAGNRTQFGVAQTTTASGDVVVSLTYNVWGV